MKPLYLRLKGSKGIYRGMGLDEIAIDFTHFEQGMIAIQGTNGTGKSTLMKHCHPYASAIGSTGKLQDHFQLRDSEKEFICEQDGVRYRSLMQIDGKTAKIEAYLYKGDEQTPMNNGQVTTYNEAVETIFGSEEVFTNALYTARKIKTITQLKPGERKEIFYRYLSHILSKFAGMEELAKVRQGEAQAEYDAAGIRRAQTVERLNNIPGADEIRAKITAAQKEIERIDCDIMFNEGKIEAGQKLQAEKAHQLSIADEAKKELMQAEQEAGEIARQKNDASQRHREEARGLFAKITTTEEAIKKIMADLETRAEIEQGLNRIAELEKAINEVSMARARKAELEKEIAELKTAYAEARSNASAQQSAIDAEASQKIAAIKEVHSTAALQYERERSAYQQKTNAIERQHTAALNERQEEFQKSVQAYQEAKAAIGEKEAELSAHLAGMKSNQVLHESNISHFNNEMAREKLAADLIDTVPCAQNAELVSTCQFLANARKSKDAISTIIGEREAAIQRFNEKLASDTSEMEQLKADIEVMRNSITAPDSHAMAIIKREAVETMLREINHVPQPQAPDATAEQEEIRAVEEWAKAEKDAIPMPEVPDTMALQFQIRPLQAVIEKETAINAEYARLVGCYSRARLTELDQAAAVLPEKQQALEELKKQSADLTYNQQAEIKVLDARAFELFKKTEQLKATTDTVALESALQQLREQEKTEKACIESLRTEKEERRRDETTLSTWLESRQETEKQIAAIDAEIEQKGQKLTRLAFIREGLGKNGIPALIIHHAGLEIARLANEFLRDAGANVRVNFDTLKPNKEGVYKETFNVVVRYIADEREVPIDDVNDGSTVWIDEAVFQAISLYLTSLNGERKYQCAFIDEKDGALAPEYKGIYLQMVQDSFKRSNRFYTIIISHTEEIWRAIPQRIHLFPDGKVEIVK